MCEVPLLLLILFFKLKIYLWRDQHFIMTSSFIKIIFLSLICCCTSSTAAWSFNQIPEELAAQLDTLEGRQRLSVWHRWFNNLSGSDNPEERINTIPIAVDDVSKFYPADSTLLFHFDILYSIAYSINNVVYFKENNEVFEDIKGLLVELKKLGPQYVVGPEIRWAGVYALKLKYMGQKEMALEYYKKACDEAEENNLYNLAFNAYISYGDILAGDEDTILNQQALHAYEKAEFYLNKMGNVNLKSRIHFYWGKALMQDDLELYEDAQKTFELYLDSLASFPEDWELTYKADYADLLSKAGQFEKAINISNEIKPRIPSGSDPFTRMYFLEEYTYVLAMTGDIEESIFLHKEYKDLIREDNVGLGDEELLMWHTKHDRDIKQAELEELQLAAAVNQASFISKIAVIGALLVLGITTLLFFLYKNRSKQKQLSLELESGQAITSNRDRLFSSITHDIRTPLALMLAPLDRAEGKTQDPKIIADLKLAQKSGTQLMKIFTQILDWNKVETNVLQLNPQIGDLDISLNAWLQNLEQEAIEKEVDFKKDINIDKAQFRLDFDKLEKIISYTFDHSLKYCKSGNKIYAEAQIIDRKNLKLIISDTGIIPAQFKETDIVDRFFKRENTPSEEGLGLGLTIVRDMTDLMDGDLKFYTDTNQKNTFEIFIPIEFVADRNTKTNSTTQLKSDDLPTLLIIEDEPDLLRFLASALSNKFNVEKASSATNGFIVAERELPDIIITDWNLPDNNGDWLIQKIKSNDLLTHTPIMVLTANDNDENKRMAFETGAIAWMSKPFQIKNLSRQLETILEQQERSRSYWKTVKITKHLETKTETQGVEEEMDPFIKKVFENLNKNYKDEKFSVDQLAEELSINRTQLYRKTKKILDKTPSNLIKDFRLEKSKDYLKNTEMTIAEIASAVGFSSPNYFSSVYKKEFGINPSEEKK